MRLALALYKYFPFGGVQRDCLRIAEVLQEKGHQVELLCIKWQGDKPANIAVREFKVRGISNHRRYRNFSKKVAAYQRENQVDGVVGFNKFSGLDVYFAADGCYQLKSVDKSVLYRLTPRYRYFVSDEEAVFADRATTHILALGKREMLHYQQTYGTPDSRFTLLPPGISEDRRAGEDSAQVRAECRAELGIDAKQKLLLMVGSGFKTKGLDRAIYALKSLPGDQRQRVHFVVIGKDNFEPFRVLAGRLGLTDQLTFFPGRTDIPRFLQAADLLVHPAYYENSGMILLEALVAGLPVLTTAACGYAHYVEEVDAGEVLPDPFDQEQMNQVLSAMLTGENYQRWRENGIRFGESADLFSLHKIAAEQIEKVVAEKLSVASRPVPMSDP
ncbi:MAG: glycosyltransferase family 4 protein [Immundisolibacteraceae bacterium]|nr:glycosyltransferase family 4 protein [Immundisolibacteraceae bacterium]